MLEIGCGTGSRSLEIAEVASNYVGIDISEECVGICREKYAGFPEMLFDVGDITTLPYSEESFSFIFSLGTLHHLLDVETTLREISRVIRPGGMFIAYEPNPAILPRRLLTPYDYLKSLPIFGLPLSCCYRTVYKKLKGATSVKRKSVYKRAPGHPGKLNPSQYSDMLKRVGFKVVKVASVGFPIIPVRLLPGKKLKQQVVMLTNMLDSTRRYNGQGMNILLSALK